MFVLDRARGAGDPAVSANAVQDRLPAQSGQLPVGHVVPDERGRTVHQVAGDRTAAVQAEHYYDVELAAPQRQPMTAVQRQEEPDYVLQVNVTHVRPHRRGDSAATAADGGGGGAVSFVAVAVDGGGSYLRRRRRRR